ncbi:MAG: hypothetical protein IJW09_08135 [Clostridia bacterium]|nr:hypothetical protein [Clostridia bacterium]
MAENKFSCASSPGSGREMVCIETNRILDSCRDRDCFENVRVFLTDFGNEILERTGSIRVKRATICWTSIHIDPVQFNRGFYSVNIRFYVKLEFEACVGGGRSQEFDGVAVLEKHVILYGSESNVNIFKSNPDASDFCAEPGPCGQSRNVPIAVVEVVDPIVLNTHIYEKEADCCCCCCCCEIPDQVAGRVSGSLVDRDVSRYLAVSLGIFSVVRIVRPAQYLIQATEYCVPDKECVEPCDDDPCAMFRRMAFPVGEFCPPGMPHGHLHAGDNDRNRCGC